MQFLSIKLAAVNLIMLGFNIDGSFAKEVSKVQMEDFLLIDHAIPFLTHNFFGC